MSPAEIEDLAKGCELAASVSWRNASDLDHSWDRSTNLLMAQRFAFAARELRRQAAPADR